MSSLGSLRFTNGSGMESLVSTWQGLDANPMSGIRREWDLRGGSKNRMRPAPVTIRAIRTVSEGRRHILRLGHQAVRAALGRRGNTPQSAYDKGATRASWDTYDMTPTTTEEIDPGQTW